jgi:hypothetical protein
MVALSSPLYKKTVRRLRSQAADPQGLHAARMHPLHKQNVLRASSGGRACARASRKSLI